jgi:uncharacterized protein YdeI (BOF family)
MKKFIIVTAIMLWAGIAVAQHNHAATKGPNGGPMQDVAGVHAELIVSGPTVSINLFDESNKPASANGFTGTVLIVSGSSRETVQLAVSGDNVLKGEAKAQVPSGAQVTLVLKNAVGKSGQVKF